MNKTFFKTGLLIAAMAIFALPNGVFAEAVSVKIENGAVVKSGVAGTKYLIVDGKKWRIANGFTFNQLVLKGQKVLNISKEELAAFPDGEVLKLSKPKITGIIDMHEHFRAGANFEFYNDVVSKLGVAKTLFVPTGEGPNNKGYEKHTKALFDAYKKYPDNIIPFCSVDEKDTEAPAKFEKCLDGGGKGLKLMAGHPNFYTVPLDSDIMKSLFALADKKGVPVLIHVSAHTTPSMKEEFMNLMDTTPDLTLQYAHYCSTVYDAPYLEKCAEFLDKYPNLYFDTSMGGGLPRYLKQFSKDVTKIRDFILKYQDRVVFGTDFIITGGGSQTPDWILNRMMCDFSFLQEKWFRCPSGQEGQNAKYALLPGLNLPNDVLKKIFVENPKKYLKME